MTSAEAIKQIEQIDGQIDANQTAVQMRLRLSLSVTGFGLSYFAWHRAYERCPDLNAQRDALYRQRGALQVKRDVAIHAEWKAEQPKQRARIAAMRRDRDRLTALAA